MPPPQWLAQENLSCRYCRGRRTLLCVAAAVIGLAAAVVFSSVVRAAEPGGCAGCGSDAGAQAMRERE